MLINIVYLFDFRDRGFVLLLCHSLWHLTRRTVSRQIKQLPLQQQQKIMFFVSFSNHI